jgi:hypothetical protein
VLNGRIKPAQQIYSRRWIADNVICGIVEDEQDNVWLSTHNGLSKYMLKKISSSITTILTVYRETNFTEAFSLKAFRTKSILAESTELPFSIRRK